MNTIELSVVIPAYMEEENLRALLPRIKKTVDALVVDNEILVVDTLKPLDHTPNICREYGVQYFNRETNNTYGASIRTAIKQVKGKYVLFMDADGSHSPEFIRDLYENREERDVVIASRYVEGGGSDNSKTLIFMSWLVNFIYAWLFDLKCKDVSNSFKLYRGELLRNLTLKCNNFDIVEEILIKIKRKNKRLKILEIPYIFKERMFGHTKRNLVFFVLSYIFTLLKLKFME